MMGLLWATLRLFQALWRGMKDEEFRALLFLAAFLLLVGTVFYHRHEGWAVIDSAFFSLITLTTVGYGDLVPTTTLSKIFTMVYLILGMSILLGFLNNIAGKIFEDRKERWAQRHRRDEGESPKSA